MGAPGQEGKGGEGPCPAPPHAQPTHPAPFAVPPSSALLPPGSGCSWGHPIPNITLCYPRKWILAGSHRGILLPRGPGWDLLSLVTPESCWLIKHWRRTRFGLGVKGQLRALALLSQHIPSLWDPGGKTQQLEQIPSTTPQAGLGGTTLVLQFPWMSPSLAMPWVRWGQG